MARRRRRVAWLIEDNPESIMDASATLRKSGFRTVVIDTLEGFEAHVAGLSKGERELDLVVLDMRLPWTDLSALAQNPFDMGLRCLELLREQPNAAHIPIVVYSAFIDNELVTSQLQPHQPLTLVDKMEDERLAVVVQNLVPTAKSTYAGQLRRLVKRGESKVLRVGALVAAFTALVFALLWVVERLSS